MSTRPELEESKPVSDEEIGRQLQRLLESEMFRTSKRCRTFLEYVVRQRMAGQTENLREKVIGVEAFGRSSGYDTAEDPVVRTTAGEVRKRLAQYYMDPARAEEVRVELLSGSYVPEFHWPVVAVSAEPVMAVPEAEPVPVRMGRGWLVGLVVLALVGIGGLVWRSASGGGASFERFWAPTLNARGPVLLSVGQARVYSLRREVQLRAEAALDPDRKGSPAWELPKGFGLGTNDLFPAWDRYVPMGDAMSLTATAVFLRDRGREFRLRGSSTTTLAELREGAAVLFGAFSNDWTLRVNKDLRFQVVIGKDGWRYVEDHQEPGSRKWRGTQVDAPSPVEYEDYAVITRIFEQTTGHPVLSVGGITHLGTRAGGEFLLSPEAMAGALASAPAGWENKNVQIVVSTKVIGASASPPKFEALYVW